METTVCPQAPTRAPSASDSQHVLRFESLFHPGRGIVVPCDDQGHVDLDTLSDRMRTAYFGARAMVGREYAYPKVQRAVGAGR